MTDGTQVESGRDNGGAKPDVSGPLHPVGVRRAKKSQAAAAFAGWDCKAQRETLRWSVDELARRCGFPVTMVAEFETGTRELSVSAQVALQRALRKGARASAS